MKLILSVPAGLSFENRRSTALGVRRASVSLDSLQNLANLMQSMLGRGAWGDRGCCSAATPKAQYFLRQNGRTLARRISTRRNGRLRLRSRFKV